MGEAKRSTTVERNTTVPTTVPAPTEQGEWAPTCADDLRPLIPPGKAKTQLNQCKRLILFLRKRGDKGASNVELATTLKILRYSSRVFSCRKSGYVIEAVDGGNGIWRYFLRHEPTVESPPYVFQEAGPTEQDQPEVLVGVTPGLFPPATGTEGPP